MFPLVPLEEVLLYEPDMKRLGVSKVARTPKGFLGVYKRNMLDDVWIKRREAFIKRHLAQYVKKPTMRRWLALMAWAYKPEIIYG